VKLTPFIALFVLALSLALPWEATSAAALPAWVSPRRDALFLTEGEADSHRLFDGPVVTYKLPNRPELDLRPAVSARIDESGRVVCFVEPRPDEWPRSLTAAQRGILDAARSWTYRPFVRNGRPVPVVVNQPFPEENPPEYL